MVVGNDRFGFKIIVSPNRMEMKVCFDDKVYNSSNWAPDSNMVTAPTLYSQIATQIGLSGLIYLLLKPFNQSPLVAEVIAGIMIGPTLLGNFSGFVNNIFPFVSTTVLENFMNLGIIYYMSQLGMEMNLTPMLKIRRKTTIRAMAGMVLPMAIGFVSYFLVVPPMKPHEPILPKLKSAFVWGIVLTATNLPDLTRVLAEQKLMRTDIGRSAVASSFLSDIAMWVFLAVLISVSRPEYTIRLCISTIAFMLFCAFLARPALSWLISVTSKGKDYRERQVQFVLCGVLVAALITDSLGLGSLLGAFMFGFTLPSGQLTTTISERIEKVSSWIMVPLYCTVSGLKSNLPMMVPEGRSVMHVILFVGISWSAKVISTFLVSIGSQRMRRPQEIFTLGVLMNSKGLLAMIAINLGRELYLVEVEASGVMMLSVLVMMMSVSPIVKYTYKPQHRMLLHKTRTIQSTGSELPFRIVACLHSKHQIQGVASLLRLSNSTAQSKIHTTGIHLVELTEHAAAAAMLIEHDTHSKSAAGTKENSMNHQIVQSMLALGKENGSLISVDCLTAISRYATMHIDICCIAEDKRAALLIVPFHEQANSKDEPEMIDAHAVRNMNQQVMSKAPCTVGLLVDRGLGKPNYGTTCLIVFYIGGADDREALSYAWRMVWRPNVHLTVVRFVQSDDAVEPTPVEDPDDDGKGILSLMEDQERQKMMDEEFIIEFKNKAAGSSSVSYTEEVVQNGDETMAIVRNVMSANYYHLCIAGKGEKRISVAEMGLSELVEFQELGAIGDAIMTSNFSNSTSVLVIQHYRK